MIKAVLFDNFGVLARVDYWFDVEAEELAAGHDTQLRTYIDNMNLGKISWAKFCESVANDLGVDPVEVEKRYSRYDLNRQMITFAKSLKQKYIVALASNAHHDYMENLLDDTALDSVFDPVFISSELGFSKPDPRFYDYIVSRLGLRPDECLMVDDSSYNITGAIEAGMQGVLFESTTQAVSAIQELLGS